MFSLNIKIAYRNLWKNRAFTFLNIAGLAFGIASFIIIIVYINYETNFDNWTPSLKRVYRIGTHQIENGTNINEPNTPGYLSSTLQTESPDIEKVGRALEGAIGSKLSYQNNVHEFGRWLIGDTSFMSIYPLNFISGNIKEVLRSPGSVAISLKKAREVFGNEDPINKVLKNEDPNFKSQYIVKAVWDDTKNLSYYNPDIISILNVNAYGPEWVNMPFITLIQLRKSADEEIVSKFISDKWVKLLAQRLSSNSSALSQLNINDAALLLEKKAAIIDSKIITEPLDQLNLYSYFEPTSKRTTIYILGILALVLIIISCINFTNLSIVQASERAKEIGIKKVLGAYRSNLFTQFLIETATQCIISFILAVIITEMVLTKIATLLDTQLNLWTNPNFPYLALQLLILLITIIAAAGIYPAIVLSGFMPAKILKGNFSTGLHNSLLRKSLLTIQFTFAGILMICFLIINKQITFMKTKDLGMNLNQLIVINIKDFGLKQLNEEEFRIYKNRLLNISGVQSVTRSTNNPIGPTLTKDVFSYQGQDFKFNVVYSDLNYFDVLQATIMKGRNFSEKFKAIDNTQNIILNQEAYKILNGESLNKQISIKNGISQDQTINTKYTIIGIVKDLQTEGFESKITPTIYLHEGDMHWKTRVIIKLNNKNISNTIKDIEHIWKGIDPKNSFTYHLVSDRFNVLNHDYERLGRAIFFFSSIIFIICLLGLLSLAAFNVRIRFKEIAIRKVLGATLINVISLMNYDFIKQLLYAAVTADILSYILMNNWLNRFIYRIDLPMIPFMLVNGALLISTIIIVSILALKAGTSTTVKALKNQ